MRLIISEKTGMSPNWLINSLMAVILVCSFVSSIAALNGSPFSALIAPIAVHSVTILLGLLLSQKGLDGIAYSGFILYTTLETIRGVIVPTLVMTVGQSDPIYRPLGSASDAAEVLSVGILMYAGVLVGVMIVIWLNGNSERQDPALARRTELGPVSTLIVLGLVGLAIRFPTFESITAFLTGDSEGIQTAASVGGPLGFASAVLRPLLPLGIALCIERRRRAARPIIGLVGLLLPVLVLSLGSYGLNRSTILFPVAAYALSLLAARSKTVTPAGATLLLAGTTIAFLGIGSIRQFIFAARLGKSPNLNGPFDQVAQTLMLYGQSPLQSAPALAASRDFPLFTADTLLLSLVRQVPGMPDELRDRAGTMVYNEVLYGDGVGRDQILPSWLEFHLSLGPVSVVILGALLAIALMGLDQIRRSAHSLLGIFASTLAVLWLAQLGLNSVSAVSQGLIYFVMLPAGIVAASGAPSLKLIMRKALVTFSRKDRRRR